MAGSSTLIDFYLSQGRDNRGRTLNEILAWDDDRLGYMQDYIQWLFPLPEGSAVNPHAPRLTIEDLAWFRGFDRLRERLGDAWLRMMAYYGLREEGDGWEARLFPSESIEARTQVWLTLWSPDYERLRRILKAMNLLGQSRRALALFRILDELYQENPLFIGDEVFEEWREEALTGQCGHDEPLRALKDAFDRHLYDRGIVLPPEALRTREGGEIEVMGWKVRYTFAEAEGLVRLDCEECHPLAWSHRFTILEDGRIVDPPPKKRTGLDDRSFLDFSTL